MENTRLGSTPQGAGFGVPGSGCRTRDYRPWFRVKSSGFMLWLRVQGQSEGLRVYGAGVRVLGLGFKV